MSYYYETPAGTAEILFFDGRWNAIFSGRRLSTHHCPAHAAEHVGKARIYIGEKELHLSYLNIPSDPTYWKRTVLPLPAQITNNWMIQAS